LTEALLQFNREGSLFKGLSKNIASERNNEYILIKNDDKEGGWSLKLENVKIICLFLFYIIIIILYYYYYFLLILFFIFILFLFYFYFY